MCSINGCSENYRIQELLVKSLVKTTTKLKSLWEHEFRVRTSSWENPSLFMSPATPPTTSDSRDSSTISFTWNITAFIIHVCSYAGALVKFMNIIPYVGCCPWQFQSWKTNQNQRGITVIFDGKKVQINKTKKDTKRLVYLVLLQSMLRKTP